MHESVLLAVLFPDATSLWLLSDYPVACSPQDSKQRLKAMQKCGQPVTAASYNHDGRCAVFPAFPQLRYKV